MKTDGGKQYEKTEFSSEFLGEHYSRVRHPSGLSVYVFPKKMSTSYALLATRYGAADNRFCLEGESGYTHLPAGVAHFLEHKLFDNPDGSDAIMRLSALGADANAYTDYDRTAYFFSATEHVYEALAELVGFVTSPYFTEETVKKAFLAASETLGKLLAIFQVISAVAPNRMPKNTRASRLKNSLTRP